MKKTVQIALLFLFGCTAQNSHWAVDAISAGDQIFNSSRIRYSSHQEGEHPMVFEMVRVGERVEAFISLNRFKLPANKPAKVFFTVQGETYEELIAVHEGGMRLALSTETTKMLIQALQDGHKIAILLDDFEEVLEPAEFSSSFEKFIGETGFFHNLFKGPVP